MVTSGDVWQVGVPAWSGDRERILAAIHLLKHPNTAALPPACHALAGGVFAPPQHMYANAAPSVVDVCVLILRCA